MSAHGQPANLRCAWCKRQFPSLGHRKTHEAVVHRASFIRDADADAAARLQHMHQDRRAVEQGRCPGETPADVGAALARRMAGLDTATFWREADIVLDHMRDMMLDGGQPAPAVFALCREIRLAARREWARLCGQERPANDA